MKYMNNNIIIITKAGIATLCAGFNAIFGILTVPLLLLLATNITDYGTGIMASKIEGKGASSALGIKGIFKKVAMYIAVLVGWMVDTLVNYGIESLKLPLDFSTANIIAAGICYWLVVNELISIVENLNRLGVEAPFLKPILSLVKSKVEETVSANKRGDLDE